MASLNNRAATMASLNNRAATMAQKIIMWRCTYCTNSVHVCLIYMYNVHVDTVYMSLYIYILVIH